MPSQMLPTATSPSGMLKSHLHSGYNRPCIIIIWQVRVDEMAPLRCTSTIGGRCVEMSLQCASIATNRVWQVSILNFARHVDTIKCLKAKQCGHVTPDMKSFQLPVRTLPSIMKELGHTHIDILKLDVEGSEYTFLEQLLDTMGCPPVNQLTMEWHHFTFDARYGAGSSPSINAISTVLRSCGFKQFFHYTPGGWPTSVYEYHFNGNGPDMRYNIVSFIKI